MCPKELSTCPRAAAKLQPGHSCQRELPAGISYNPVVLYFYKSIISLCVSWLYRARRITAQISVCVCMCMLYIIYAVHKICAIDAHTSTRVWLSNFYLEKICIYLLICTHRPVRHQYKLITLRQWYSYNWKVFFLFFLVLSTVFSCFKHTWALHSFIKFLFSFSP